MVSNIRKFMDLMGGVVGAFSENVMLELRWNNVGEYLESNKPEATCTGPERVCLVHRTVPSSRYRAYLPRKYLMKHPQFRYLPQTRYLR